MSELADKLGIHELTARGLEAWASTDVSHGQLVMILPKPEYANLVQWLDKANPVRWSTLPPQLLGMSVVEQPRSTRRVDRKSVV